MANLMEIFSFDWPQRKWPGACWVQRGQAPARGGSSTAASSRSHRIYICAPAENRQKLRPLRCLPALHPYCDITPLSSLLRFYYVNEIHIKRQTNDNNNTYTIVVCWYCYYYVWDYVLCLSVRTRSVCFSAPTITFGIFGTAIEFVYQYHKHLFIFVLSIIGLKHFKVTNTYLYIIY